MKLRCPDCEQYIDHSEVSQYADVVKCKDCDKFYRASKLIAAEKLRLSTKLTDVPVGSRILVKQGNDNKVDIVLPAKGIGVKDLPLMILSTLLTIAMLYFVVKVNVGAIVLAFILGALAAVAWLTIIRQLTEVEVIKINGSEIGFHKERLLFSKHRVCTMGQIDELLLMTPRSDNFSKINRKLGLGKREHFNGFEVAKFPTILVGNEFVCFFTKANLAEKYWVINYLESLVQKHQ